MARVIAVVNQKGGVAKTTTVVNLASGLVRHDRRVLVIDVDPQANSTLSFLGRDVPEHTLYDSLVLNSVPLQDLVVPTSEGVDLIPSHILLSAADLMLAGVPGRERLLARKLRPIAGYDYILFDSPPSLGILTVNSLTAASEILIPVAAGTFSLQGIKLLEGTITQIKENLELQGLQVKGVVATLYDRTKVAADTLASLKKHFDGLMFETVIPRNKDVEEAHGNKMSVLTYAPKSRGAEAYRALAKEVIARE